jgi:hypothetical protein
MDLNNIIIDSQLVKKIQTRFPRSKKKRIQKKWRNNRANFITVPDQNFYRFQGKIACHPVMFQKLKEELQKEQRSTTPWNCFSSGNVFDGIGIQQSWQI